MSKKFTMGNSDSAPARTEDFVCVVLRNEDIHEVEQNEQDEYLMKGLPVDIIECEVASKSVCMEDYRL